MGRNIIQLPREDWRERLFWTSIAGSLIALLLFALVALAEWGERAESTPTAGFAAQPGSTGLMADLLIPPPAPPTPFMLALPQLPAVSTAARKDPGPACRRGASDVDGRPLPVFVVRRELCPAARPIQARSTAP